MANIEKYKSVMASGLKNFFESHEESINELINSLDSEGLLLKNFSKEQVTRLQNITRSCNMALILSNDFNSLFSLDKQIRDERLKLIMKAFNTNNEKRIAEHFGSILVTTYLTFLERLKIYFLFFIDWKKLGKKHKCIHGIGNALKELKRKYPQNKFLDYFDSGARNSFAHYTFFWTIGSKIMLCSEMFDSNPKEMPLVNLMKEIWELNVLTEGFYILIADKFGLPEITPERMEK
ncbi:MAG: hypothetical protein ABIJ14_03000 [Nanoarchaeota archaeon]